MKMKVFAIATLLAGIHQAAHADRHVFETHGVGVTTNVVSHMEVPVGSGFRIDSRSFYDDEDVNIDYSPNGARIESVLGKTTWALRGDSFGNSGCCDFDTYFTATFNGPTAGSLERSVDLTMKIGTFRIDNGNFSPSVAFHYHLVVTGDLSLGGLLNSAGTLNFGSSGISTLGLVKYGFFTEEPLPTLEMRLTNGSIVSSVPEPATSAMLVLGLGLTYLSRRARLTQPAANARA